MHGCFGNTVHVDELRATALIFFVPGLEDGHFKSFATKDTPTVVFIFERVKEAK